MRAGKQKAQVRRDVEPASPSLKRSKLELVSKDVDPDEARPKEPPPQQAVIPERPPSKSESGLDEGNLLLRAPGLDAHEEFSKDEQMLNNFIRRHPMLSLEATSYKTMQLVSQMVERSHVVVPELPSVPKSYDDQFLAPPSSSIGERECICGARCLGVFIAKMRYGMDSQRGFVCKEFLLPDQHASFLAGKGLPTQRQKCLLCTRYFTNYVYILARTDPNFSVESGPLALQTFSNPICSLPEAKDILDAASEVPTHASTVSCSDGYKPDAMLFVDEEFASNRVQRDTRMSALSFRPVVRFCSTHYRYAEDDGGKRIIQVGIGADDHMDGLSFRGPPPRTATAGAATTG